jgi:dinuclear metal center YbgI/SA1388 family protein
MALVTDVVQAVETIAPPALAEEWDNCGLQVGNPEAGAKRILVALTPVPEIFDEADGVGANFLLLHHPLIFGGMDRVDLSTYPGDLIGRAIREGITIYAAHTSYDAAPNGVSVALAEALGLRDASSILVPKGGMRKLVVFVPEEDVDAVAESLDAAGAGRIGDYTRCTFRTKGAGTFLGGEGADPYLGQKGRLEQVPEVRLETVVPAHLAERATEAVRDAHPYEEPAIDLYPVEGHPEGCGYGRAGHLPAPLTTEELREHVSETLGFPARLVADPEPGRRIESVAVMGGSGGSFIRQAAASGADAYVTGDLDYHDALLAGSLGLTAVDAGHAATELPSLKPLAEQLSGLVDIPVSVSRVRR